MARQAKIKTTKEIVGNAPTPALKPGQDAKLIVAKAKAKAIRRESKANLVRAKGEAAAAKTATARTKARARALTASIASVASARAEVAKTRAKEQANMTAALDKWNSIINGNSQPAEGTGNPQSGDSGNGAHTGSLGITGN